MRADDSLREVQEVVLLLGRLGIATTAAIEVALGPDVAGHGSIITLFDLDLAGPRRPGDIQQVTGLTSGGVSKLLDRLEGLGLVARTYGALPEDRRGAVVSLTAKGTRTARAMARAAQSQFEESRDVIIELAGLVADVSVDVSAQQERAGSGRPIG